VPIDEQRQAPARFHSGIDGLERRKIAFEIVGSALAAKRYEELVDFGNADRRIDGVEAHAPLDCISSRCYTITQRPSQMRFSVREFEQLLQYLGSWLIGREWIAHEYHHVGVAARCARFCARERAH
jgi:hypothetical protein